MAALEKKTKKAGLVDGQNFLTALKSEGWPVVAVDLGGLVKRFGRQAEVKYQSIADGLRQMGYSGIGFGPADLRLPAEELVAAVAPVGNEPTPFLSANVGPTWARCKHYTSISCCRNWWSSYWHYLGARK